ncbi:MAG: DUF3343 domain-containing protein [Clostridia bacterium]|nr:DUF3343 domain-containing protein [Clostridia bacterium]MBR5279059.1 DUF3343 domain-containing protein [Clostridia bacterium]
MKYIIILSSITYALKAQELLKNNGIYANITRSKNVRAVRGCGYGLSLNPALADNAKNLMAGAGIPIVGSAEEK